MWDKLFFNLPLPHCFLLSASDPPGTYNVLTTQSHDILKPLPPGHIYRINTGGPLPVGADTVIMVEDTELVSTFKAEVGGSVEEKEVRTLAQIPPGENVRAPGSDVKQNQLVMSANERITRGGGEVGTLTFIGRKVVSDIKSNGSIQKIELRAVGQGLQKAYRSYHEYRERDRRPS